MATPDNDAKVQVVDTKTNIDNNTYDVFGKLSDEWCENAKDADGWRGRLALCKELYNILEPISITNDFRIKFNPNTQKIISYLIDWLNVEKHIFTRIKLLEIFTKSLPGLETSIFDNDSTHIKFASSLMNQWAEKKVFKYITPILILLWKKGTSSHITIGKWTQSIHVIMLSKNPTIRTAFWEFITDISIINPIHAANQFNELLLSGKVLNGAIIDVNNRNIETKKAAIKFLCITVLFMSKNKKNEKYIKQINDLCNQNIKIKSAIIELKDNIRKKMKTNSISERKINNLEWKQKYILLKSDYQQLQSKYNSLDWQKMYFSLQNDYQQLHLKHDTLVKKINTANNSIKTANITIKTAIDSLK